MLSSLRKLRRRKIESGKTASAQTLEAIKKAGSYLRPEIARQVRQQGVTAEAIKLVQREAEQAYYIKGEENKSLQTLLAEMQADLDGRPSEEDLPEIEPEPLPADDDPNTPEGMSATLDNKTQTAVLLNTREKRIEREKAETARIITPPESLEEAYNQLQAWVKDLTVSQAERQAAKKIKEQIANNNITEQTRQLLADIVEKSDDNQHLTNGLLFIVQYLRKKQEASGS